MKKRNAFLGIVLSCSMLFGFFVFQSKSSGIISKSSANVGWYVAKECGGGDGVQWAAAGAAGAAGQYAGAWAGAKVGALIGTTCGPVGSVVGGILGCGLGAL